MIQENELRDALAEIGLGLVLMVVTSKQLRHESPSNSLMYMEAAPETFARDYTKWCDRYGDWEAARDRCLGFLDDTGLGGVLVEQMRSDLGTALGVSSP